MVAAWKSRQYDSPAETILTLDENVWKKIKDEAMQTPWTLRS